MPGFASRQHCLDIGAGTGSVSVEAAAIACQGKVYAIERDAESIALLSANRLPCRTRIPFS